MPINDSVKVDVGLVYSLNESIIKYKDLSNISKLDPESVNNRVVNGDTLLHVAVRSQNKEAVQKLLQIGADPGVKNTMHDRNAFHLTAINGNKEIFSLLEQKNSKAMNANDRFGIKPKDLAIQCKNRKIVEAIKASKTPKSHEKREHKSNFASAYLSSKTNKSSHRHSK